MEGNDVFASRCERFTYQDVLGTGLGWYGARLFGDKGPTFTFTDGDSEKPLTDFLQKFQDDCDGMGHSLLNEAHYTWFPRAVAFGHMYVYFDRRKTLSNALTLLDQQKAGVFDPYVATFDPLAAINWSVDDDGALEWIVFKVEKYKNVIGQEPVKMWRWFYVDKEIYQIFEAPADGAQDQSALAPGQSGDAREATLVDTNRHAIAGFKPIVPVIKLEIPPHLAFGDRVYPVAIDHVNSLNELKWLHMQCCLAVPVITGVDSEFSGDGENKGPSQYSEITTIVLPKGGEFGWSEPEGKSLEASAKRVEDLMQEIYRMMYLLAHARSVRSTPAAQSGVSKYEDARASIEVLSGFGEVFRAFFKKVLQMAALIADQPKVHVEVGGMDFSEPDALGEIEEAQALLDADPPSDTLIKEVYKDLAKVRLRGKPKKTQDKALAEIDAAPGRSEQRAQAFANNANQFADQTTIFKGDGPVTPPPPSLPA